MCLLQLAVLTCRTVLESPLQHPPPKSCACVYSCIVRALQGLCTTSKSPPAHQHMSIVTVSPSRSPHTSNTVRATSTGSEWPSLNSLRCQHTPTRAAAAAVITVATTSYFWCHTQSQQRHGCKRFLDRRNAAEQRAASRRNRPCRQSAPLGAESQGSQL